MAMDPKSKNIDCYFYFYSECVRGNFCKFRHEPAALGCEEMCQKWKDGNCTEPHCSLRHMELKKKRKEIACYWEMQPGGCRKAHCAFKHQQKSTQAEGDPPNSPECSKKDSETSAQEWRNAKSDGASSLESSVEASSVEASRRLSQGGPESYASSPAAVEPIVVNFEEESDSESAPSWTPTKVPKEKDSLHVKTLEEIRLEKIQAESAAYWEGIAGGPMAWEAANPAANPSASPCASTPSFRQPCNSTSVNFKKSTHVRNMAKELDFRVLSLDEIRKNRARKMEAINGLQGRRSNPSFNTNILSNDQPEDYHFSSEHKNNIGVTDLRVKLSNANSSYSPGVSYLNDTGSFKRQHQDQSPKSGPCKKQCIRLRRLSELTGDRTLQTNTFDEVGSEDAYVDRHILKDIDKILME